MELGAPRSCLELTVDHSLPHGAGNICMQSPIILSTSVPTTAVLGRIKHLSHWLSTMNLGFGGMAPMSTERGKAPKVIRVTSMSQRATTMALLGVSC